MHREASEKVADTLSKRQRSLYVVLYGLKVAEICGL